MAIDDHPFDALEKHFNIEDSSISPVTKVLLFLSSLVPWIWPLDKAFTFLKNHAGADSAHKAKVMLETCMSVVRVHENELTTIRSALSPPAAKDREEATAALIVDAARKAVNTRSLKRIERIGIILANGIIQKTVHPDHIEEMMRVAMDLSDSEIDYLGELVRIEGDMVAGSGRIARYEAHTKWEQGRWGKSLNPELDSVFSKLASYGLVVPIPPPNNLNIMADFQNRYALLPKGLHFYTLITSA